MFVSSLVDIICAEKMERKYFYIRLLGSLIKYKSRYKTPIYELHPSYVSAATLTAFVETEKNCDITQ